MPKKFVIGSRGSDLAVTQTRWAIEQLQAIYPKLEIEHKLLKTQGDKDQTTRLDQFQGLGVFVKELQTALLKREIDCAVHSLKDVPENQPQGLSLVSFPIRESAEDVFISNGTAFKDLPSGSKVGTGSPRRIVQLQKLNKEVEFVSLRGNLDTRIAKVKNGELDGIVLAAAGIKRLALNDVVTHSFSFDTMIPAIGQGCLALECRSEDKESIELAKGINDEWTEVAVRLEREFMQRVGGGCKVPMACHVYPLDEGFRIMAMMGDTKTNQQVRLERSGSFDEMDRVVSEISEELMAVCRSKKIPIPKDLPEHALLRDI